MLAHPPQHCRACGGRLDVHNVTRGYCGRRDCTVAYIKADRARVLAERHAAVLEVAMAHADALRAQHPALGADLQVMVVPGFDAPLEPAPQSRRDTLAQHVEELLALPAPPMDAPWSYTGVAPGHAAAVGIAACTACQGYCCRKGGDSAFLTAHTMARVRAQHPQMTDVELAAVYRESVPDAGMAGSCIYHGARGCTLRREFRADICNTWFCDPVRPVLASREERAVVAVMVEDLRVKRSVLVPAPSPPGD